jgi:hypothetical protein
MTWQDFVAKVNTTLDALGLAHDAVDVRYIDVLGSEGVLRVEVLRKDDDSGRHDMFVE